MTLLRILLISLSLKSIESTLTSNATLLTDFSLNITFGNPNIVAAPSIKWDEYPTFTQINAYLKNIAALYPHCSATTIGKSYWQQDIMMMKITTSPYNQPVLLKSGIHGNKWLSVLSVLFFIESIGKNFTAQPAHIQQVTWFIIPVINPDGYTYSMKNDPGWGKNRKPFYEDNCHGVDLNNNFPYKWSQGHASKVACNAYFCGRLPFSESETLTIRKLVDQYKFWAFLAVQSVESKYRVLAPTASGLHLATTKAIGAAMRQEAKTRFVPDVVIGEGMAMSWLFHDENVRHSYTIQSRDKNVKPQEMLVSLKEVRRGIIAFSEMLRY